LILGEQEELTLTHEPQSSAEQSPVPWKIVYVPWFIDLLRDDSGQDLIEYALLATLISLATVASLSGITTRISGFFTSVTNAF
jgi:pilus assembly protein Flp/PilA